MRKIVVVHPDKNAIDLEAIRRAAPGFAVEQATDEATRHALLPHAEVLLGWADEAEELCLYEGTPLRFVQSISSGVDTFPLEKLDSCGVKLATASGVHARPVAETAFALMLALVRGLPQAIRNMESHKWQRGEGFEGLDEIHGKTLGILGAGHIGQEAARMASGLAMRVLGLRRSGAPTPGFDEIYADNRLHELLAASDIVLNILPATDDTCHLMDAAAFAAMRPGAGYINVGRGQTTDTGALVDALRSGQVSAAGLDVTDPEPLPADSPLWDLPGVIILPHYAGFSRHQTRRIVDLFCENLAAYTKEGTVPRNLVDYSLEY